MDKFILINLNYETNLFEQLANSVYWEDITKGRKGGVLIDIKNEMIPIVRTTTIYNKPAQLFSPIHNKIIEDIKKVFPENLEFNNALIEIYESNYRSMKFHSDQSLDLNENSYIGIFSCYDNPTDIRTLKIQEKSSGKCFEIKLEHNSVVLFSYDTNYKHLHKIFLDSNKNNNKWLGITFRLSKTFIKFFRDGSSCHIPYLDNNKKLKLANDNEIKEFYQLRGKENSSIEFKYPELDYTISPSDLITII